MYRALRLAAVLAVAVLVGACGGGGNGVAELDAKQIRTRAVNTAKEAETIHVKGRVTRQNRSFGVDMRLADRGATGTVTLQGKSIDLRRLGQQVYLRPGREFYASQGAPPAAQRLLGGKWFKSGETGTDLSRLASFTKPDQFFTQILKSNSAVTKGEQTTVHGTPAIELLTGGQQGVLLVALEGPPYPLQIRSGSGSESKGTLTFLDYNQPITLKTPPPGQVLSPDQLRGGG